MLSPLLILAGTGILSLVLLAILTILIVGIQRCDRGRRGQLIDTPTSRSDALTRRLLVGVRDLPPTNEGNDQ
jgi:hypothetical protein